MGHSVLAAFGEQVPQFPAKRLGRLLQFSIGHARRAERVESRRVAREDVGKADNEVVHLRSLSNSILSLTVAFLQPLRACEAVIVLPVSSLRPPIDLAPLTRCLLFLTVKQPR